MIKIWIWLTEWHYRRLSWRECALLSALLCIVSFSMMLLAVPALGNKRWLEGVLLFSIYVGLFPTGPIGRVFLDRALDADKAPALPAARIK